MRAIAVLLITLLSICCFSYTAISATPEAIETVSDRLQVTPEEYSFTGSEYFDPGAKSATFILGSKQFGFIATETDDGATPVLLVVVREKIGTEISTVLLVDIGLTGRIKTVVYLDEIQTSPLSRTTLTPRDAVDISKWNEVYDEAVTAFMMW